MCKGPPAAQARGLRDQSKGRRKVCLDVVVTLSERAPHGYWSEENRNIIGPVDSVRRITLGRKVPPAEEPAESATKKRQCVSSHRPKELRERHQSNSRGRLA